MKKAMLIFLIIVSLGLASASYISGDIYIRENGEAVFSVDSDLSLKISGLTFNSEEQKIRGTTEALTKKENGIWIFNLNLGTYETILLDIHLPKNLESIESIKGVDRVIDVKKKTISIIDNNKKLEFEVLYKLENTLDFTPIFLFTIILLVFVVILLDQKRKNKNKQRLDFILPIINDNEKKIVEALMKKPVRQKDLRKQLGFPKASFSRYIINLQKKKLIVLEGDGRNRIVRLK